MLSLYIGILQRIVTIERIFTNKFVDRIESSFRQRQSIHFRLGNRIRMLV